MSNWQGFLDGLATKGGNILLLASAMTALLAVGLVMMVKFGPTAPSVVLIVGAFNGFQGALLLALVGKDRNGGAPPATH